MRGLTTFAAVVAWTLAAGPPVRAQSNPSADDIIKALRPTPGMLQGTSRGIRPLAPNEEGTPTTTPAQPGRRATTAAARASGKGRPTEAAAPSVNLMVQFRTGSAELTPEAEWTLDQLGRAISSDVLNSYRFRIEGHTDTVGTREANQTLSQQRAAAVAAYLTRKFGVAATRLEAVGVGEDHPLVPTGDQVAEPRNRRVEVINLGA